MAPPGTSRQTLQQHPIGIRTRSESTRDAVRNKRLERLCRDDSNLRLFTTNCQALNVFATRTLDLNLVA